MDSYIYKPINKFPEGRYLHFSHGFSYGFPRVTFSGSIESISWLNPPWFLHDFSQAPRQEDAEEVRLRGRTLPRGRTGLLRHGAAADDRATGALTPEVWGTVDVNDIYMYTYVYIYIYVCMVITVAVIYHQTLSNRWTANLRSSDGYTTIFLTRG